MACRKIQSVFNDLSHHCLKSENCEVEFLVKFIIGPLRWRRNFHSTPHERQGRLPAMTIPIPAKPGATEQVNSGPATLARLGGLLPPSEYLAAKAITPL